jgi:hypothetical protein
VSVLEGGNGLLTGLQILRISDKSATAIKVVVVNNHPRMAALRTEIRSNPKTADSVRTSRTPRTP